jgi:GYF domain 2
MQSYSLKISDRAEGPYAETQISQLYADGRIDRHTPCRPATGGDWKTIDDFLPMLKYGTQLPVPTPAKPPDLRVSPEEPPPTPAAPLASPQTTSPPSESRRIALVDVDLPFVSILRLMFKWMAAAFLVLCCFIPALVFLLFIVMAIFGSLLGHMFSGFQNP